MTDGKIIPLPGGVLVRDEKSNILGAVGAAGRVAEGDEACVPKEIKVHEYRVGLTPDSVRELTELGHQVTVETSAGCGIGFSDHDYLVAGATIGTVEESFAAALAVKGTDPKPDGCARLPRGRVLFT